MKTQEVLKKNASFGLKKFPVGIWNYTNLAEHGKYMTEAEMDSLADAGITVPQGPSFDPNNKSQKAHLVKMLDWAHERGMKLIPWDPRCMARGGKDGRPARGYEDDVRAALADFGDHPGLFGFYLCDEPGGDRKDAVFACQRVQKQLAPHLFPFLNHLPHFPGFETGMGHKTWGEFLDEYVTSSNADYLSYDCYAQMLIQGADMDSYYRNLRFYREASLRHGIPFWNTVMSVGHMAYRCPTLDDFRWQFNTSVASGANGISWFFWYMKQPQCNYRLSPVDEHWEKTQTYYDIRRIQKSFHRTYGDLFNRLVSTRVSFFGAVYGGGEAWTPNDLVSDIWPAYDNNLPMLIGEFTDAQGRRYVMFVNNSMTKNDRIKITFPKNVKLYSWDWNGQEREGLSYCVDSALVQEEKGQVGWHWLSPGQEAVYRIEIRK